MKARSTNSTSNTQREQPKTGTHKARLLGITDLGHQPGFVYEGKAIESQWKYEFTYELVQHTMQDGRPFVISEDVTNKNWEDSTTSKRSKLVSRARSLLGDSYRDGLDDLSKLLGQPCTVSVELNAKGYSRVCGQAGVGSITFGDEVKELTNESYIFDMDSPDMELWDKMPEFKRNKIESALNFNETELARELNSGNSQI